MARYRIEPKVKPHLKASSPESDDRRKAELKAKKKKTAPNNKRKRPNRSRGLATLQKLKVLPPPPPIPPADRRPIHELLDDLGKRMAEDIRSGRADSTDLLLGLGCLVLGALLFRNSDRRPFPLLGPPSVDDEEWPEEL